MDQNEFDETDQRGGYLPTLQSNILRGIHFSHARFLFIAFRSPGDGLAWLQRFRVSEGGMWLAKPKIVSTVAFTHRGLAALGVRAEILGQFSEAFRAGMRNRGAYTDDDLTDLRLWDRVFVDGSIHALVSLYGERPEILEEEVERLCNHHGVTKLDVQPAALLKNEQGNDVEHFGFRDGISQPIHHNQDTGEWNSDVPIGQFLIFPSGWNDGKSPEKDPGLALGRLGTYLVYRKLEQRVHEFHHYTTGWGSRIEPELVAAKIIGRWPDGTPVTERFIPPSQRTKPDENGFDFSDDPEGRRCPIGAHISRVNPRSRVRAGERRILRRGMPYGQPVQERQRDAKDERADARGLVFIALNASIERQFEFVQRAWINEPGFGPLDGVDPIASTRKDRGDLGKFRFYEDGPSQPVQQFVRLRGGEYFFVPSIPALVQLAKGEFSAS
jgi:Dyp-type peroxidase family